ncbi:hypothetical protein F4860DRAFT_118642 [Xylaria cubensis]|nr:hypothetical protein F4860DRAFT_118642 [Xylaria cubensis]
MGPVRCFWTRKKRHIINYTREFELGTVWLNQQLLALLTVHSHIDWHLMNPLMWAGSPLSVLLLWSWFEILLAQYCYAVCFPMTTILPS